LVKNQPLAAEALKMDSAKIVVNLMEFFTQQVKRVVEAVEQFGEEYDARSLEAYVEAQSKALGAVLLESCWQLRVQEQTPPPSLPCPCGRVQHHWGRRPRAVRSVMGEINLEERHYYHCDDCGEGRFTGDELRGSGNFTQLAEERLAFAGKEGAFVKGAESLERLAGMKVSPDTVQNVCKRTGGRSRALLDEAALRQYGVDALPAEEHPRCLAIGVDGVMIGRVDPQHRQRRSKTKGKVRGKKKLHHFFHEVKTLVVFDFDRSGKALRKTYYATQERVDVFRGKVALEAARRGADTAHTLVFLGDGALWVWRTAEDLFPKAVQILDWFHAMEHLWSVGRARFGSKEKELWAWVKTRETELWEGQVEEVVAALEEVARELGQPDESLSETARAQDARWIASRNVGYFRENAQRMNYPLYRKQGLPIGSGTVESACKHVVAARLKGTGMRWDEEGAENILALRCQDLNGRWDSLWPLRITA
jgi:hypothetical protein